MKPIEQKCKITRDDAPTKDEMIQRIGEILLTLYYEDVEFIYKMILRLSERR